MTDAEKIAALEARVTELETKLENLAQWCQRHWEHHGSIQ